MRPLRDELAEAVRAPLTYAIWGALTVVLAVGGPFDTYDELSFGRRLAFWGVIVGLSVLGGRLIRLLAQRLVGDWPILPRIVAVAAAIGLGLGPVLWLFSRQVMGANVIGAPQFILFVFVVGLVVQVLRLLLAEHRPPPAPNLRDPGAEGPRLFDRIAPELRGQLLRLSARNHYIEVHTDRGQTDILLRFSDALAELAEIDGAQVHRSHWVAWAAVTGAERERSRVVLVLSDGARVPVSRRHERLLADRGLI